MAYSCTLYNKTSLGLRIRFVSLVDKLHLPVYADNETTGLFTIRPRLTIYKQMKMWSTQPPVIGLYLFESRVVVGVGAGAGAIVGARGSVVTTSALLGNKACKSAVSPSIRSPAKGENIRQQKLLRSLFSTRATYQDLLATFSRSTIQGCFW